MSTQGLPTTNVPDTSKADGQLGTGSNATLIDEQDVPVKYVPEAGAADDK